MRSLFLAATMVALASPVAVYAQAAKFSTSTSTINQLMADPQAKAVIEKHMPQIAQAQSMVGDQTLKALQSMAPDRITDKLLADVDTDLAKIK